MSEYDYDIIVVGAGPAGSSAAKEAALKGAKVLLVDRRKEIGAPVRCGEGLGAGIEKELNFKVPKEAIDAYINGAELYAPNNKKLELRNEASKGYVIDRKKFDKFLAEEAARAGAEVIVKTRIDDLKKEGSRFIGVVGSSMGERFEASAKVIIAADGGESLIARKAGINSIATLYDSDFGIEYEMVGVDVKDVIEIYFSNNFAPRGYAWVFPKGKDSANVGVGVDGLHGNAIYFLKKFLEDYKERFENARVVAVKGGLITVGMYLDELVKQNLMVVGEAAHQVDPVHGGGIALSMKAGKIAGRVACEYVKENKDISYLQEYKKEWDREEKKRFEQRLELRKVLEKMNDEDLNAIFDALNSEDLQKVIDGDFKTVVKKVSKILIKRPSLVKLISVLLKW
ncbi:MAG: geranylgeranyl reductase family protein [Candidatus Micrarchaeia archaeon]